MVIKHKITYSVFTEDNNNNYSKDIVLKISEKNGMYIIHRALIKQLNNKRQGTTNTKNRSDVRGGGKKPWKQKGTGRARVGSIRSPLWKGGGVIFGPKNRKYKTKINKKEQQLALKTLLFNKFQQTCVIDKIGENIHTPKTKSIIEIINNLNINLNKKNKILLIVVNKNSNLYLSLRNLANIELIEIDQLNIFALLKADKIIITVNALEKINEIYNA
ncbi:50S ribosomal protein L4 (plastid) [Chondrus crispus]|uniref:Large ribosomal subunit protein uL4c n=1 Tax=Chondrus crispus TaxID=2769 RepID=M5DDH0_CHOCR|nr:50S ribosomal protein L4 [Chondrus crispus]CCP38134.1 50S ribosomal protein L4 [Chondrus crispus]|eukprot:YP_007627387.1 50S ribosomal protein L4 (plastid) [Chondrus crispus]